MRIMYSATFLLLILISRSSFAKVYIVNNNSNAPAGHYATINAAAAAAIDYDTIYVVGSPNAYDGYEGGFLNKPLTFIGAGYKPLKDFDYPSTTTGFRFFNGNGNCKIAGFNITAGIYGNTAASPNSANNLEIANNSFLGFSQIETGSNCDIHDNIFYAGFYSYIWILGSNNTIHNNIFSTTTNYSVNISTKYGPYSNNAVYNNVFLSASSGFVFRNVENFEIANNIFYGYTIADTTSSTVPINCNFNNNMVYNTGNNFILFGNNYTSTGINYTGILPLFVNPTPNSTFDFPPFDFKLQAGSVGHNGGVDGTDIGPFGGIYPFDNFTGMQNIPVVIKLDIINPIIGLSDSLQIHSIGTSTISTLLSAEYFFDKDPGQGRGMPIHVAPADSTNSLLNISHGLLIGTHVIGYRVMNANGVWSIPDIRSFDICTISGSVARFDFHVNGKDVIFENNSTDQESYRWDFGDGDTSIRSSMIHHFDSAGIFNVCLNSKNICNPNGDILCKKVAIKGINSISPDNGGNIGAITMTITGALFNNSSHVKLTKVGQPDILCKDSSTFISNGTVIKTSFDLDNAALGLWNLVVEVPGDTVYTLLDGFKIDSGRLPKPYIQLIGPKQIRRANWYDYTFTVGNKGNIDAVSVPVWFAISPDVNVRLEFEYSKPDNPDFNWDTMPTFFHVDTLFDQVSSYNVYAFIIPGIPPGSFETLNFKVRVNTNQTFKIKYWTGRPFILNSTLQRKVRTVNEKCFVDEDKLDCLTGLLQEPAGLTGPVNSCIIAHLLALLNLANDYSCFWNNPSKQRESLVQRLGLAGIDCINEAKSPFGKYEKAISILRDLYKWFGTGGTLNSCFNGFNPDNAIGEDDFALVTSYDPNDKSGNTGMGHSPFINSEPYINYRVHFENVDTATAPAQTVIVKDSLDDINLDLSTLQLNSIGFANTIVSIPAGKQSFTVDFDLRPNLPLIARLSAFLNMSTHVLTGRFESLDPLTMEPTDSVLLGFLLPNDSTGKGEGFISYSVKAKTAISTGTVINNKAHIYFDENAPIITPTWTNIIDDLKPQSQVNSLPATVTSDSINISWSGSDSGPAGVYAYNIYYKVNEGNWLLWKYNTSLTSDTFVGKHDSTYSFYSVAIDSALNIEEPSPTADAFTTISSVVLPITLSSFSAHCVQNTVSLEWVMADQLDVKLFTIEKSPDGITWISPGNSIHAHNSPLQTKYNFSDIYNGRDYYRLLITGRDSRSNYSPIIKINCGEIINNMQVYPVPAKHLLNIIIQAGQAAPLDVMLTDISGRTIRSIKSNTRSGTNYFTLNTEGMASGQYILKANSPLNLNSQKVIIIH